jgi:hypothetical protein
LPLRHLYCHLDRIFDQTAMKNLDLMRPVFFNLTHLELMDGLDQSDDTPDEALARWARLSDLPKLTHLALNSSGDLPLYIHLLAVCRSLRALILLRRPPYNVSAEMDLLANNPRFVMMPLTNYIADWQRGVLGCKDYWARADALIAQRMSGEIDRASVPEHRQLACKLICIVYPRSHFLFGGQKRKEQSTRIIVLFIFREKYGCLCYSSALSVPPLDVSYYSLSSRAFPINDDMCSRAVGIPRISSLLGLRTIGHYIIRQR